MFLQATTLCTVDNILDGISKSLSQSSCVLMILEQDYLTTF